MNTKSQDNNNNKNNNNRNNSDDDDDADLIKEEEKQQVHKKRSFIRLVVISDTHQYHEFLTLPKGDVLIHCGDILMTDRFNLGFVSNRYLTQFFEWFNFRNAHAVKLFIGGNHCAQMEKLWREAPEDFAKLVKPAIFLGGDEVIEAFDIRFFGNSWSTSTGSGNVAFQTEEIFGKLKGVGDEIENNCRRRNCLDVFFDDSARKREEEEKDVPPHPRIRRLLETSSSSQSRRAESSIDILISHCNMPRNKEIVQSLNPALHLNGHYHGYHGLRRG
jgi:hypothetical protein